MSGPPSPLIEIYLREVGFWHAATIGRGCKLDPKLISDIQLQLRLPVDGAALTGSVQSADWGAICYNLLGEILDNIYGGQIEMGWLRDRFLESGNDSTKVKRIRYAQAYILEMIKGYLISDLSRNLVHLRWLQKLVDFRAAGELSWGCAVLATLYWEMCGVMPPNKAKIRGGTIQRVMLEYLPLLKINGFYYANGQKNKVLRQVRFRQSIPEEPEVLNDQHKIDLRLTNTDWTDPWQTIFAVGRAETSINPCGKGTMVPFKSKKKGRWHGPINNTHTITGHINSAAQTITEPNASIDDTHITAL
ncbi:hypothetical protein CXB51_026254 [Gossypium anomalum]|uniref:Aminotransferase-like plant mobile domain-containing protein n=1 Tax=Gossypium anomalum TaxID=47600 RepID=A0A8J5Z4Z2_9ROSI|nr:hypothetical protein CXB51_026254 [Gossypium anomalum]